MSQPRYAPAGLFSRSKGFSFRGTLFSTIVLALAVLICLPVLPRSDRRAAAATAGQPATASVPQSDASSLIDQADIKPSTIRTGQPAAPARPKLKVQPVSNDGLIGPAGETGELGIPAMVLTAYQRAAAELAKQQPSCHLPWWLLAGIGHTESGHAESGRLYADGTTRGRILGPVLNGGIAGDAVITDTDHGAYDGDTRYDRAVGPMQFIPSTWKNWGADGNADGKRDPNNIFDATLAAGRYLCADGRDLATPAGQKAAVLSYNHSQAYLDTVLAWGYAYRSGASALPDQTTPVVVDVTKVRPPLGSKPPQKPHRLPAKAKPRPHPATSSSSSGPTHTPGAPASSGTPTATPTPTCTSTSPTSASPSGKSATSGASGTSRASGTSGASGASTATAAGTASPDGTSTGAGSPAATLSTSGTATGTATATCTR